MLATPAGVSLDSLKEFVEKKLASDFRMSLKTIDVRPRYVKICAPLRGNLDHAGSMCAGAQFTLAEISGSVLCLTIFDRNRYHSVVKEMTIRFVRPARTDLTVEYSLSTAETERIQAALERYGESDFVLTGHLIDQVGDLVATTRCLYQLREIGT